VNSPAQLALETTGLTKTFGDHRAVNEVSLSVPRGSVFGFLGPNGSGKTTTIRMLLGLAEATSGSISVLGHTIPRELDQALPKVGALVEGPAFYPYLSGRANLMRMDSADRFSDSSTRASRVESALTRVGLANAAGKKAGEYSLGMKQRLGLANALLKPRELLVLDEPTNGLDPQGTREVRHLIRALASEGITIFLSSHLLSEIEQLCSHVAVMSEGRLVATGTLDELRGSAPTTLILEVDKPRPAIALLKKHGISASLDTTTDSGSRVLATVEPAFDAGPVNRALVEAGISVRAVMVSQPSLEDYFVALTGEGFEVAR
jgi:ABC-type multidrug transport system ATPase subunit